MIDYSIIDFAALPRMNDMEVARFLSLYGA